MPEFELIKQLKQRQEPLSVEELKEWEVDHNPELDKPVRGIPTEYVYEDDNPTPTSEERSEPEKAPPNEASI